MTKLITDIITPKFCPICGEKLHKEAIGQRRFNKYRYWCKTEGCPLGELKHRRDGDKYYFQPIYEAITEEKVKQVNEEIEK